MSDAMQLLMVHGDDDGGQVLPDGVSGDATQGVARPAAGAGPEHLWDEGGDPNDLSLQRWA